MVIPRRELLDRDMYTGFATIQATRGCPYNCDFCTASKIFGRSYRCRPVDEVVAEIKSQADKKWMFVEGNLVAEIYYAKNLFQELIPLEITWGAQVSFSLTQDHELMNLNAAAGGAVCFYRL